MAKYFYGYNMAACYLKQSKLLYLGKVSPKVNLEESEFLVGPFVYSKFITSKKTEAEREKLNLRFRKIFCFCDFKNHICKFTNYYIVKNINDVNLFPDYDKFIMNSKGEIYTTLTGFYYLNYYYLHTNYDFNNDMELLQQNYINSRMIQRTSDTMNLIKFVYLFIIGKERKLPRFIIYLIIMEFCELNFYKYTKCICKMCGNLNCDDGHECCVCKISNVKLNKGVCGDFYCEQHECYC